MHTQESIDLLGEPERQHRWHTALRGIVERPTIHGLVRGVCCRSLLEHDAIDDAELQRVARLALSAAVPRDQSAAWIEGVLHGSAFLLMEQRRPLGWRLTAGWSTSIPTRSSRMLPLVRRAFADV